VYVDEYRPGLIYLYPGPWRDRQSLSKHCIARLGGSDGVPLELAFACAEAREVWIWRGSPAEHCLRIRP
jgi:hypothetical protein